MPAIGLYFAGLTQSETNALRARLNGYAKTHGYIASRGPTAGEGNLAQMLIGIDAGEIALIPLGNGQWDQALEHLETITIEEPWAASFILGLRKALESRLDKEVGCLVEEDSSDADPLKQKVAAPD